MYSGHIFACRLQSHNSVHMANCVPFGGSFSRAHTPWAPLEYARLLRFEPPPSIRSPQGKETDSTVFCWDPAAESVTRVTVLHRALTSKGVSLLCFVLLSPWRNQQRLAHYEELWSHPCSFDGPPSEPSRRRRRRRLSLGICGWLTLTWHRDICYLKSQHHFLRPVGSPWLTEYAFCDECYMLHLHGTLRDIIEDDQCNVTLFLDFFKYFSLSKLIYRNRFFAFVRLQSVASVLLHIFWHPIVSLAFLSLLSPIITIVMFLAWLCTWFGLVTGCIVLFYVQLVTTLHRPLSHTPYRLQSMSLLGSGF